MFRSNGLAAKGAVRDLITGLPEATSEKWHVTWGYHKAPERTWVYLGDVEYASSEWATNNQREEQFTVQGVINVKRRRGGPEETEHEVSRIAALIENAIDATRNLGLPAVVTCAFVPKRMGSYPSDEMCEAQLDFDVRVTARLR